MSRFLTSLLVSMLLLGWGLSFYPMEKDRQLERPRARATLGPAPTTSSPRLLLAEQGKATPP